MIVYQSGKFAGDLKNISNVRLKIDNATQKVNCVLWTASMIYGVRQRGDVPKYAIAMLVAYTPKFETSTDFMSHIFIDAGVSTNGPSNGKLNNEMWKTLGKSMKDYNNRHIKTMSKCRGLH